MSPIRWIQRPDRNAVTMVPMTLRVCGGDDGTPTRLVGRVDQCGTVVAWAAGNREDPLEPSPWNQQLPPEEDDDSDADPPRRETARPAASIGIVLYHKLSDEPDDGYHRHRRGSRRPTSVPSHHASSPREKMGSLFSDFETAIRAGTLYAVRRR